MITTITAAPNQADPIDSWADAVVSVVEALETAGQRLATMRLPDGPADADARLAGLRRAWGRMGVRVPSLAATQSHCDALAVRIERYAGQTAQSVRLLLDAMLKEVHRLMAEGAEDSSRPPVLLAEDFGELTWTIKGAVGSIGGPNCRVADPRELPPEHPARVLAAELGDRLYQAGSRRVLVLGRSDKRWYEIADVRELTLQWSADHRRVVEEREKEGRESEERERRRYDESPQGQTARLQGILNGLIEAVKARPSAEHVARLEAEMGALRGEIAKLKSASDATASVA